MTPCSTPGAWPGWGCRVIPQVRYARSGDVTIAYQVVGDAPVDLIVGLPQISHLEVAWEGAEYARMFDRLSSFSRLMLFDKRGVGMSDRGVGVASLEERMDDIRAVLDAVGSERAVVFGASESGPMAILFAATYPERTTSLVVYGSNLCGGWRADNPVVTRQWPTRAAYEQDIAGWEEGVRRDWGESTFSSAVLAPSRVGDPACREWLSRMARLGSSPASAIELVRMNREIDIRPVLPSVHVPTLVLHRGQDSAVPVEYGRYLAAHIAEAKYVELPGVDHLPSVADMDLMVDEIEEFVTGVRRGPDPDRVLLTVLFTDIAGSSERAARLGDRAWAQTLERHNALVRRELDRYRGREVDTAGDGFFAVFDGPARAVRCALEAERAAQSLGLEIRAGAHTGECELAGEAVRGVAVHVGARVAAQAGAGEVLVTSTVKDLAAGSGLSFQELGSRALKGIPGEWSLYRARA
jgi:class 3 adenylate cyclase